MLGGRSHPMQRTCSTVGDTWYTSGAWEKRGPRFGCLGYRGDEIFPSYVGSVINHEIRISIKQLVFHGK